MESRPRICRDKPYKCSGRADLGIVRFIGPHGQVLGDDSDVTDVFPSTVEDTTNAQSPADLDGDGDHDIVIGNDHPGRMLTWLARQIAGRRASR